MGCFTYPHPRMCSLEAFADKKKAQCCLFSLFPVPNATPPKAAGRAHAFVQLSNAELVVVAWTDGGEEKKAQAAVCLAKEEKKRVRGPCTFPRRKCISCNKKKHGETSRNAGAEKRLLELTTSTTPYRVELLELVTPILPNCPPLVLDMMPSYGEPLITVGGQYLCSWYPDGALKALGYHCWHCFCSVWACGRAVGR